MKQEIAKFNGPVDLVVLTERCEDLERYGKVINALLAYNVMKNADSFVDGLTTVKGLSDDLQSIKQITSNSKSTLSFL
jgi:hypothetical protein